MKNNPAALLALCWYWASDGVGAKVYNFSFTPFVCIIILFSHCHIQLICISYLFLQDMVVLPYKDSLLLFSRYLQQLVMESLGKEFDLDGNRVYISSLAGFFNSVPSISCTSFFFSITSNARLIVKLASLRLLGTSALYVGLTCESFSIHSFQSQAVFIFNFQHLQILPLSYTSFFP